ncbi:MAG TPA: hypothetical protein VKC89_01470 [Patescibacteria group bacterium]|nr:hypothetical protein [Patescibacteria group bacterium]
MNKKLIIGGLAAIILLVGGLVLFTNKSTPQTTSTVQEQSVPTISADEIGLTLKPGSDGHRVVMAVAKTDGISSLDYELSYTAKGNLPRGAIGHIDVKSGKSVSQEIYLGTCSDVCHPDSDVTNIKLILKVTKTDGKVYQAEAKTSL